MNNPLIGYLSSFLFLLAGIFMIAGGKTLIGILFIVLAIASVVLNYYLRKHLKK